MGGSKPLSYAWVSESIIILLVISESRYSQNSNKTFCNSAKHTVNIHTAILYQSEIVNLSDYWEKRHKFCLTFNIQYTSEVGTACHNSKKCLLGEIYNIQNWECLKWLVLSRVHCLRNWSPNLFKIYTAESSIAWYQMQK